MLDCLIPDVTDPVVRTTWEMLGYLGQAIFAGRWLVQWVVSERSKRSVVPIAYWYMSLFGGLITLSYACAIGSGPFIVAQTTGVIVYLRNLVLIRRGNRQQLGQLA
jgi:lipid-A-disaccharide synthase-like uncharacterized protein